MLDWVTPPEVGNCILSCSEMMEMCPFEPYIPTITTYVLLQVQFAPVERGKRTDFHVFILFHLCPLSGRNRDVVLERWRKPHVGLHICRYWSYIVVSYCVIRPCLSTCFSVWEKAEGRIWHILMKKYGKSLLTQLYLSESETETPGFLGHWTFCLAIAEVILTCVVLNRLAWNPHSTIAFHETRHAALWECETKSFSYLLAHRVMHTILNYHPTYLVCISNFYALTWNVVSEKHEPLARTSYRGVWDVAKSNDSQNILAGLVSGEVKVQLYVADICKFSYKIKLPMSIYSYYTYIPLIIYTAQHTIWIWSSISTKYLQYVRYYAEKPC